MPRLGLDLRRKKPHQVAGFGLMGFGGFILLQSMPLHFWTAAFGGFLVFLGYTLQRQRC